MANVNLLIGSLLFKHAKNISECKHFLMLSINAAKSLDVSNEKVKNLYLRACSYLSGKFQTLFKSELFTRKLGLIFSNFLQDYYALVQSSPSDAVSILKSAIETSKSSPYWHLRLILKLIRLKSENNQIDRQKYLDIGAKLASDSSSPYLKILFLLAKSLDQLKSGSFGPDFDKSLSQIESMTNQQTSLPVGQLHSIKLFLQSLQVKHP